MTTGEDIERIVNKHKDSLRSKTAICYCLLTKSGTAVNGVHFICFSAFLSSFYTVKKEQLTITDCYGLLKGDREKE